MTAMLFRRFACTCPTPAPLLFRFALIAIAEMVTFGLITPLLLLVLGTGLVRAPGVRSATFIGVATTYTIGWVAAWGYFLGSLSMRGWTVVFLTSLAGYVLVWIWLPRYRDAGMQLRGCCRCGAFDAPPDPPPVSRPDPILDPIALRPMSERTTPQRRGRWDRRDHHGDARPVENDIGSLTFDGEPSTPRPPHIRGSRRRTPREATRSRHP